MSDTQRALSARPTMAAAPAVSDRDAIALARELDDAMKGPAAGDAFTRGRYATDASIYQIMPAAVAFPRDAEDAARTLGAAPLTVFRKITLPLLLPLQVFLCMLGRA